MFYWLLIASWTLESFWPPRWYVLSSELFKQQIDLQLQLYYLILKKSVAWVKCIWQSANIKHEQMYEQNLFFPFVRFNLCGFGCGTVNDFAVAVGRKGREREREMGERWTWLFLSFDFFLATLERNHSYCLLKVCKLIVYINNY